MKKNDIDCREPYEAPSGFEALNKIPMYWKVPVRNLLSPYFVVFVVGFIVGIIW